MAHPRRLASFLLFTAMLYATAVKAGDHDEHHHGHGSGSIEIGLSNSLVYIPDNRTIAYGLHVHAIYTFGETPIGLGLGYELIAGEHLHQTVGPMFCYRPTDPLNLCLSPGVIIEGTEIAWSAHFEATYEMELYGVHIGPTLGFAITAEGTHISPGLHTGLEF